MRGSRFGLSWLIGMFTWLLAATVAAKAHAESTLYVDDDNCPGPGVGTVVDPFCQIHDAITASTNGDEIIVSPGLYHGTIDFAGKTLSLRSAGGPQVTIINPGSVLCQNGEGPGTLFQGFTVTNGAGSGMIINNSNVKVINCVFAENADTGMLISSGTVEVIECAFIRNAGVNGAGIQTDLANVSLANCVFLGNTAIEGGGMFINRSSAIVTNCVFSGNLATGESGNPFYTGFGGGIRNTADNSAARSLTFTNCTFSRNQANRGGGLDFDNAGSGVNTSRTITNCILWENVATFSGNAIQRNNGASPTIRFSDIQGSGGSGAWDSSLGVDGGGNIDADPVFLEAAGPDGLPGSLDDNVRLSAGSPAIDAGENSAIDPCRPDLDGHLRRHDDPATVDSGNGTAPIVDMGAYEFASAPSFDCNDNGVSDVCDIGSGASQDQNSNGVPDECDPLGIPTVSEWGLTILALAGLIAGSLLLRERRGPLIG